MDKTTSKSKDLLGNVKKCGSHSIQCCNYTLQFRFYNRKGFKKSMAQFTKSYKFLSASLLDKITIEKLLMESDCSIVNVYNINQLVFKLF